MLKASLRYWQHHAYSKDTSFWIRYSPEVLLELACILSFDECVVAAPVHQSYKEMFNKEINLISTAQIDNRLTPVPDQS